MGYIDRLHQKWVTDITYVRTGEGFLYLCVVKDLFNSVIVGWSMSSVQNRDLVLQSVLAALWQRPKGLRYCTQIEVVSLLAMSTSSFLKDIILHVQ
jgi:transposase InsO family protein